MIENLGETKKEMWSDKWLIALSDSLKYYCDFGGRITPVAEAMLLSNIKELCESVEYLTDLSEEGFGVDYNSQVNEVYTLINTALQYTKNSLSLDLALHYTKNLMAEYLQSTGFLSDNQDPVETNEKKIIQYRVQRLQRMLRELMYDMPSETKTLSSKQDVNSLLDNIANELIKNYIKRQ